MTVWELVSLNTLGQNTLKGQEGEKTLYEQSTGLYVEIRQRERIEGRRITDKQRDTRRGLSHSFALFPLD